MAARHHTARRSKTSRHPQRACPSHMLNAVCRPSMHSPPPSPRPCPGPHLHAHEPDGGRRGGHHGVRQQRLLGSQAPHGTVQLHAAQLAPRASAVRGAAAPSARVCGLCVASVPGRQSGMGGCGLVRMVALCFMRGGEGMLAGTGARVRARMLPPRTSTPGRSAPQKEGPYLPLKPHNQAQVPMRRPHQHTHTRACANTRTHAHTHTPAPEPDDQALACCHQRVVAPRGHARGVVPRKAGHLQGGMDGDGGGAAAEPVGGTGRARACGCLVMEVGSCIGQLLRGGGIR